MKQNALQLYQGYVQKAGDRFGLFELIKTTNDVSHALYPGSYLHITPSLLIPAVTYVDEDRCAKIFIIDPSIYTFIAEHKTYTEEPEIHFLGGDFRTRFEDAQEYYDLLISQYAGFVGQFCKQYLRRGGLLLANDCHGDAIMASLDKDYTLVATINQTNSN